MYHEGLNTELVIDETLCENTSIEIKDLTNGTATHHFLTPKELRSFIYAIIAMQSLLCSLCYAIFAMHSLLFKRCHAIFAVQSLLCNLCSAIFAVQSLLCSQCK